MEENDFQVAVLAATVTLAATLAISISSRTGAPVRVDDMLSAKS